MVVAGSNEIQVSFARFCRVIEQLHNRCGVALVSVILGMQNAGNTFHGRKLFVKCFDDPEVRVLIARTMDSLS